MSRFSGPILVLFLACCGAGLAQDATPRPPHPPATAAIPPKPAGVLRLGMVADVHKDLVPDADARLRAFVDAAATAEADGIVQLGDFCHAEPPNREFLAIFERFRGKRVHVIGNHDTDGGHSREEVVAFWQMPSSFYSFELGGFRFVVLDGNDPNPAAARRDPPGRPWAMAEKQIAWLAQDLAKATRPVVLFSHQSLATDIENSDDLLDLVTKHNRETERGRVVAAFCGHHHGDEHRVIHGIHFVLINSSSYKWMGSRLPRQRFSDEVHAKWPALKHVAPYEGPVYAIVDFDPKGKITIHGRATGWVGPSPIESGLEDNERNREKWVPRIRDRVIEFAQ